MGFEPMEPLRAHNLSRVAVSTTHTSLLSGMESLVGVEPTNNSFADCPLIRLGTTTYSLYISVYYLVILKEGSLRGNHSLYGLLQGKKNIFVI
jgi:hypothetical protein